MKLPREILVGPHLYRIRSGKVADRQLIANRNEGECHHPSTTIYVAPHLADSQKAETLLHELMHAAFDQTPLRAGNTDGVTEEEIVCALSPILLTMFRANPELIEVLTGRA